jgi:exonuclease III
LLNKYIYDDDSIGQLFQTKIKSEYHDITLFAEKHKSNTDPLIISINIQSINSKYEALKTYVYQLSGLGIQADIIVMQETWEVKFPTHFHLPGYQAIVARTRVGMRGGGVGFFVREGLHFKERTDFESHTEKTFENLVLEVTFPNKTIIISNIYRSPTPPRGTPGAIHMENFLTTLDAHLSILSDSNKPVYVFLDANINLLKNDNNQIYTQYLLT